MIFVACLELDLCFRPDVSLPPAQILEGSTARISIQDLFRI